MPGDSSASPRVLVARTAMTAATTTLTAHATSAQRNPPVSECDVDAPWCSRWFVRLVAMDRAHTADPAAQRLLQHVQEELARKRQQLEGDPKNAELREDVIEMVFVTNGDLILG